MPAVSICLTTYNRAGTLSLTVDSILNQSFSDFELIISDDNSSDDTALICNGYVEKDSRVRYYCNPANLKMPGNLNKAISYAKGEFIANLHDGDIYENDLISKWYNLLQKYDSALFVFNQYKSLDAEGNFIRVYDHKLAEVNKGEVLFEYFLRTGTSAPWGTVMARKEAYEKFGSFNSRFGFISDVEMWLRLGLHGDVCYVNEPLIDLIPREKNHPYYFPNWRIFSINFLILFEYYPLYSDKYPNLKNKFPLKDTMNLLYTDAVKNILILLKHRKTDRVRQGIYVIKTLPGHKPAVAKLLPDFLGCPLKDGVTEFLALRTAIMNVLKHE